MVIMVIIAFVAGVTIVVSRMLNAKLSEYVGVYMSTFMNFVTGLIGALILAAIMGVGLSSGMFETLPKGWEILMYFGGILGVLIVVISNVITKKIPAYQLTLLMFITQLFAGMVLDYLMYEMFSPGKLIGGLFVVAGLWISMRGDKDKSTV